MAKTVSAAFETHLDGEATTITTLWEITRRDGTVIRLTELDADVLFEGNTFLSAYGFQRTAIENEEGLRGDTMDIESILNSAAVSREEVLQGLYNYAEMRIYVINYESPLDGAMKMRRGTLGEVLLGASDRFQTELASMVTRLDSDIIEKTSATCRVNVGNARCSVPIDVADIARSTAYEEGVFVRVAVAPGTTSEVYGNLIYECTTAGSTAAVEPAYNTAVDSNTTDGTAVFTAREAWTRHGDVASAADGRVISINVTEPRAIDAWFNGGRIRFESGPNAGFEREIKSWVSGTTEVTLFEDFPFTPTAGNVFTISPGCDKLRATCLMKWAIAGSLNFANGNVINFQGEPDLPGRDAVLLYPDAQ